jgi:hypothetical protein
MQTSSMEYSGNQIIIQFCNIFLRFIMNNNYKSVMHFKCLTRTNQHYEKSIKLS